MGKKGLSLDEKRDRMLKWFHQKATVFQLKEIEKGCSKECGITSMSIKDVLATLTDDGLVDWEKIGTSNYYWAFASKDANNRKRVLEETEAELAEMTCKKKKLEDQVEQAKIGREPTDKRVGLMNEMKKLTNRKTENSAELARFSACDPEVLKAKAEKSKLAKDAANRWTDNIFSIKSFCQKKFEGSYNETNFNRMFNIPPDLGTSKPLSDPDFHPVGVTFRTGPGAKVLIVTFAEITATTFPYHQP